MPDILPMPDEAAFRDMLLRGIALRLETRVLPWDQLAVADMQRCFLAWKTASRHDFLSDMIAMSGFLFAYSHICLQMLTRG